VDDKTVYQWMLEDPQFRAVQNQKAAELASAPNLGELVQGYLVENLTTITAQQRYFRSEEFLHKSDAAGLATLHGVSVDKAFRLLAAAAAASGGRGDPDAPREIEPAGATGTQDHV
jgi:hypothetical protein